MGLLDLAAWQGYSSAHEWRQALTSGQDSQSMAELRQRTQTGRVLATDSFLSKLEVQLGCRLRALPVGRPKVEGQAAKGEEG